MEKRKQVDLKRVLFPKQFAFATSRSKRSVAVCSRRAGKSYGTAAKLLLSAFENPGSVSVYVNRNQENARYIIWPPIQEMSERFGLKARLVQNRAEISFPNGSKIIYRGAGSMSEIEKLRGFAFVGVVIDEAQSFGRKELSYLIREVLEPTLMDHGDRGWLAVTGTPNAACAGAFYDISHNVGGEEGWEVHHWTMRDNVHIPDVHKQLRELKSKRGWGDQHPTFRREYGGEWVKDEDGLVFYYSEKKNLIYSFNDIKAGADDWSKIIAVDIGFNDPTAFVVLAYSQIKRMVVVVESFKEKHLPPSRVAAYTERLFKEHDAEAIVYDTGGIGKGYAEELNTKFGLKVDVARKTDKLAYIERVNDDFMTGALKIVYQTNRDLLAEIEQLQWDQDKMDKNGKLEFDRGFQDHLSDALIYGHTLCWHTNDTTVHDDPAHGSREYWRNFEKKIMEEHRKSISKKWWQKFL